VHAFSSCTSLTSVTFQSEIASNNLHSDAFGKIGYINTYIGDLRDKYLATGGGIGTYTRPSGGTTWTKQAGGGVAPGGTYIITGGGTSFTAINGGATIGTGAIQDVINAIRTHATGKNPTIQFGNGTSTFDIGEANAFFNNFGGTWGELTLTGKITSAIESLGAEIVSTIRISDSISVTSTADIVNTCSNLERGMAIHFQSTGTLTISGGTVSSALGYAVLSTQDGTVSITGGTVSTTSCIAVYNSYSSTLTITGGTVSATSGFAVNGWGLGTITVSGTAKVTSANPTTNQGTIYLPYHPTATTTLLEITGGTVENTSTTTGNAVYNDSTGAVIITGGTVSKKGGGGTYAVYNGRTGKVTIGPGANIVGNTYGL
jgi:hypothetical protein